MLREKDLLTRLLNRNSYENKIKVYARADLHLRGYGNGLHELNNALGHEAGTRILTLIGKGFQQVFDEENPFRIDGDEFVSPVPHDNEENNQEKIARIQQMAESEGVSCFHWLCGGKYRGYRSHSDFS